MQDNYRVPLDTINISLLSYDEKILIRSIKFWQEHSYSNNNFNCQFHPSCSNYFAQSIIEHNTIFGIIKGSDRIIRCNGNASYYFNNHRYNPKFLPKDGRMIDNINPEFNPHPIKNSSVALLFSIIPGLGRFYTGRYVDGLFSFSTIILLSQLSYNQYSKENYVLAKVFGSFTLTLWLSDFYGAWRSAKLKK